MTLLRAGLSSNDSGRPSLLPRLVRPALLHEADRDAGTPGEPIGFALTHKVTARLVEDILG